MSESIEDLFEVMSEPGRFGPLAATHPIVGRACPVCDQPMVAGDEPAFVNPVPSSDEDAAKAAEGRYYTAEVQIAHARCVFK